MRGHFGHLHFKTFQWHQEHPNPRCFGLCCRTLNIREFRRTPSPQLWECEFHPHTWPKWGCDIIIAFFCDSVTKKNKTTIMSHLLLWWFCCSEKGDNNNKLPSPFSLWCYFSEESNNSCYRCFLLWWCYRKKKTTTTIVTFFDGFVVKKRWL